MIKIIPQYLKIKDDSVIIKNDDPKLTELYKLHGWSHFYGFNNEKNLFSFTSSFSVASSYLSFFKNGLFIFSKSIFNSEFFLSENETNNQDENYTQINRLIHLKEMF